jgi:hypothetical protein
MEKFPKVFEFSVATFFVKFVELRPTLDCWDGEARRIIFSILFFSYLFIFFSYCVQNYIVTYPHHYSVIKESWRALRSIYLIINKTRENVCALIYGILSRLILQSLLVRVQTHCRQNDGDVIFFTTNHIGKAVRSSIFSKGRQKALVL